LDIGDSSNLHGSQTDSRFRSEQQSERTVFCKLGISIKKVKFNGCTLCISIVQLFGINDITDWLSKDPSSLRFKKDVAV
jgi:hypothetical protein